MYFFLIKAKAHLILKEDIKKRWGGIFYEHCKPPKSMMAATIVKPHKMYAKIHIMSMLYFDSDVLFGKLYTKVTLLPLTPT